MVAIDRNEVQCLSSRLYTLAAIFLPPSFKS